MNFQNDIDACLDVLNKGGIILYPTDTIWGIGCDATNEEAVTKIYALKKREEKKSMIILLTDEDDISLFAKTPTAIIKEILKTPHEPLTIIYPDARNLAVNLVNEDRTIAIRIVKDEFCGALINAFKKPIVSTSANISGELSPENFDTIHDKIKKGVDYIVQHRSGNHSLSKPSRIIKWEENDEIIVIRK